MRITLNLATKPYADQGPALKRLRLGMAVLAVVLIGLAAGLMHFHQAAVRMAAQEAMLDQSIAKVRQEDVGYQRQMEQPANAKVLTQAVFLNQLFEEKTFSWTAAMEDLERVLPGGVQVTAIEPARAKDGKLTLKLRISGMREPSVQMVRNMERSKRFVAPRISGENAENSSTGGDLVPASVAGRVTFEIQAEYNPATLDERKAEIAVQKRGRAGPVGAGSAAVKPVLSGGRPGYVAPNPMMQPRPGLPVRQSIGQPMNQRPGMQRRMPGSNPGQAGPEPGIPIGVDLNGLRNHEGNRFPPGQVPPTGTVPDQTGGPQ